MTPEEYHFVMRRLLNMMSNEEFWTWDLYFSHKVDWSNRESL